MNTLSKRTKIIIAIVVIVIIIAICIFLIIELNRDDKNTADISNDMVKHRNTSDVSNTIVKSANSNKIFTKSEINEIKKGILTVFSGDIYNSFFGPNQNQTISEDISNKMNLDVYAAVTYHLFKKYGSNIKNIKVPPSKQLPVPRNISTNSRIPTTIRNYCWWLVNSYQPKNVVSDPTNFQQCIHRVINNNKADITKDKYGKLHVNQTGLTNILNGITPCVMNSKYLNSSLDDILEQVNRDLRK